jgi:hypothetical protein
VPMRILYPEQSRYHSVEFLPGSTCPWICRLHLKFKKEKTERDTSSNLWLRKFVQVFCTNGLNTPPKGNYHDRRVNFRRIGLCNNCNWTSRIFQMASNNFHQLDSRTSSRLMWNTQCVREHCDTVSEEVLFRFIVREHARRPIHA